METPIGAAATTIMEDLGQVREYSFFQLNSMLQRMCDVHTEQGDTPTSLRYRALPSLAFPAADINHCSWQKTPDRDLVEVYVSFMGLFGPASPLPVYYTERVIQSKDPNHPSRDFMDLFNHRAIKLLQRCWDKYRYYAQYKTDGMDQYTRWLLSAAGIDIEQFEKNSQLKWPKLLPLVGLLANNRCSADMLQRVIQHYFGIKQVEVKPWLPRTVHIQCEQRNSMGIGNSEMGINLVMGDEVLDCSGKFSIHLNDLSDEQFNSFMPSGSQFTSLVELVQLVQKSSLDFDLCLYKESEKQVQVDELKLEQHQMGWCSTLGSAANYEPATICVSDYLNI